MAGQWFGWQCRWYDLPPGSSLTNTRRTQIEDALRKTERALPDLTDWVLWTRHTLTKSDQEWFYALKTSMHLALWTAANVGTLLAGEAEILRSTYFGELVLTPSMLADQHDLSTARIKNRWLPEVHQVIDAERKLRRMLGEATAWSELDTLAQRLLSGIAEIKAEPRAFRGAFSLWTREFVDVSQRFAEMLQSVHELLKNGDFELLRVVLESPPQRLSPEARALPKRLRNAGMFCGLYATNALADIRTATRLSADVADSLGIGLVGIVADAGGGKTQLAAQLTAPMADRPGGILLFGRELHSGRTVDNVAAEVVIHGHSVPSFEALIAALDAAGQRSKRRLPIVIDGLNEAEDPREWQGPLATLKTFLRWYANVLLVCTVRTGARRLLVDQPSTSHPIVPAARLDFAKQALPDDVTQIDIPDFGHDTSEAVQKYFTYFRIVPGDAEIPWELFSHPLTLRIYCEVTNGDRKKDAIIDALPRSLAGLFEQYIDNAIKRIAELAPRSQRYFEQDVRSALDIIGMAFWQERVRALPKDQVRQMINDQARPWNESIVQMLEQEGVVLRIPGDIPGREYIVPVYDALGGYLIANAILTNFGRTGLEPWFVEPETLVALSGNTSTCHPLALDIFRALVSLVPSRLQRKQVWQMVEEPLQTVALRLAATLDRKNLDAATIDALAEQVRQVKPGSIELFLRFFRTRGIPDHPLNAEFLGKLLRSLPMGQRDLQWTEWVRENASGIRQDVQSLEEGWQDDMRRGSPDRLRAEWVLWVLTTTVLNLRDRATRALYWFGRGNPSALFELAEQAADIDDPSVFERVLAASYGVAMAAHYDPQQPSFSKTILPQFGRRLFDLMFSKHASRRTTHVLTREYGRRFIELAALHNRQLFKKAELARIVPPYAKGGVIPWGSIKSTAKPSPGGKSPLGFDFENYTLGRLVENRGNYDFAHLGYRRVRNQILWRIGRLGWSVEKFEQVDRSIQASRDRYGLRSKDHYKIDRYGKKYSSIAFFELKGWLQDRGKLSHRHEVGRTSDVDIDPSFPDPTKSHRLINADFLGDPNLTLRDWITAGPAPDFTPYLRQNTLCGEEGEWVALDAYVAQQDEGRGRRMFAFLRSFLVPEGRGPQFIDCLNRQPLGGRWLPEKPRTIYTFTGEMPWCETFPEWTGEEMSFVVSLSNVKVKRKRPVAYVDGERVVLTATDLVRLRIFGSRPPMQSTIADPDLTRATIRQEIVEVEEVRKEVKKFKVAIPVWDFGWEGRTIEDVSNSGDVLAKRLATAAKLVHLPQTHDLQTAHGRRATYGIEFSPDPFNNAQQLFYIREDVLRNLLKRLKMTLVWAVWGERELSQKQIGRARPDGDLAGFSHGDFQAVLQFQ